MNNTHKSNSKYPLVIQQYDDVWAVWFKKSRSFLLLAEPAFEILKNVISGKNKTEIKRAIKSGYGHSETETNIFVDEIIQYIKQYNSVKTFNQVSKKKEANIEKDSVDFKFTRNYLFGKTLITIHYQDE